MQDVRVKTQGRFGSVEMVFIICRFVGGPNRALSGDKSSLFPSRMVLLPIRRQRAVVGR